MEKKQKKEGTKSKIRKVFDLIFWALPFVQKLIEKIFPQANKR